MTKKTNNTPDSKDLIRQLERLRETASKDALTGLLNRGTAENYIKNALENLEPDERCAMFIVDLDHFKQVNDTLGHQAGDEVLVQAARILSGLFRAKDIVGRLGGDEFIIFLRGDITEAVVTSKGFEICQQIQLTAGESHTLTVTASVGICLSSGIERDFDTLYRMTDQALYESKREGRRRFRIVSDIKDKIQSGEVLHMPAVPVKLSQILTNIDNGVALFEWKPPYSLIYANPSFREMACIENESGVKGDVLSQIVSKEDRNLFDSMLVNEKKEALIHNIRVTGPDGNLLWCRVRIALVDYDHCSKALMVSVTDISELKEKEKLLKSMNERLKTAFDQTGQGLWEVDISTGRFRMFEDVPNSDSLERFFDFPEGLIGSGMVHPDSAALFRSFSQEIYSGSSKGYGNFILRHPSSGAYTWSAMSYTMLYDAGGHPLRAIGITESLSQELQHSQPGNHPQRFVPESIVPYLIMHVRGNLSRDAIRDVWNEGKSMVGDPAWSSYSQIIAAEEARLFSRDDLMKFNSRFRPASILDAFHSGIRWFSMDYRRIDENGCIQWVALTVSLYEDDSSGDILLFGYLFHVDQLHKWEASLGAEIRRDPVTKLYTRTTAQQLVDMVLGQIRLETGPGPSDSGRRCAAAMILINGVTHLYADNIEKKRFYIAGALHAALGPVHISGQYSRDRVIVFFPDMPSEEKLQTRLERAFSYIRTILADTMPTDTIRFVVGAICVPPYEADFDDMIKEACRLCDLWENSSTDRITFPNDQEDRHWKKLRSPDNESLIQIHRSGNFRPLSEAEKDTALRCISGMLLCESLSDSMQHVLAQLGKFYQADRTYLLTTSDSSSVVTMPCEWTAPGKTSIQVSFSGMSVKDFPVLARCREEQAPIFLSRQTPSEASGESWKFMMIPLSMKEPASAFLCIENARVKSTEIALPVMLIPYILREKQRYHSSGTPLKKFTSEFHESLPNLRTYTEMIYSFTSDTYSSLGTVCVDIPDLSSINGNLGFEYGKRLLWYVSQTIAGIFGKDLLFRTWDSEFVVLCPNSTHPVFINRYNRLRSALNSRYPGRFRLGQTWAEKLFCGKDLVEEARSIMRCETPVHIAPTADPLSGTRIFKTLGEAIQANRFTVFFQPKINMITGSLIGAEALVRGIADDGGIIPPSQFIDQLEKNKMIRDLDFYVLDCTLALMEEWLSSGMIIPSVSINFSRVTLFDPAALASVLAIHSRYPSVSPELIEIEITESAGNISHATLDETMQRFRDFGIRFSLDDFGSQYSNLSIFTNVKFDVVKLDRSLINDITQNKMNQMLVKDLAKISRSGGMKCIAEGVENREQIDALLQAGCIYAQGFYYDRPLSPEQFEEKYLFKVKKTGAEKQQQPRN